MELKAGIMEYTKEQTEGWIKQYGKGYVWIYKTKDGKSCVLRTPDLTIIDACRTISGGRSTWFDIALVENCWLAGDEVFKKDTKYQLGLHDWLGKLIVKVDGQMEEL